MSISREGLRTGHPGDSSSLDLGAFVSFSTVMFGTGKVTADARHVASVVKCAATSLWQRISYNFWQEFSDDKL